jgi:hypothetical protein
MLFAILEQGNSFTAMEPLGVTRASSIPRDNAGGFILRANLKSIGSYSDSTVRYRRMIGATSRSSGLEGTA